MSVKMPNCNGGRIWTGATWNPGARSFFLKEQNKTVYSVKIKKKEMTPERQQQIIAFWLGQCFGDCLKFAGLIGIVCLILNIVF